jgi:hypothetical protein
MKSTVVKYLFYITFIFTPGCVALSNNSVTVEQQELFLGAWSTSPKDHSIFGGYHIYIADGTVVYVGYNDVKCNQPIFVAHGDWKIDNNKLIIKVTKSTNPKWLKVGTTIVDSIVEISDHEMVLKSNNGTLLYRVKGLECGYENKT